MVAKAKVTVNLRKLKRFSDVMDRDFRQSGNGPIRKALNQWAFRYRSFSRRRWLDQSKGGGAWPALKPATVARRRKKSDKILIDTATMLGGFTPMFSGKPGQVQKDIKFGVNVGVGGSAKHPSGQITMGELYKIHHFGLGRVPVRTLVVEPDSKTVDGMVKDMRRGLRKAYE